MPQLFYDSTDNAQLVLLIFGGLLWDLKQRPLAEVLGLDQGEEEDASAN